MSLLLPHVMVYNSHTIKTAPIIVLRYDFSFNIVETLAKATMTSIRGLKTEANNRPLICAHHDIITIIAPETNIRSNY